MHNNTSPHRKEILKELVKSLHKSDAPEAVKDRFKKILMGVSSVEIAIAEEELINEGMTREVRPHPLLPRQR